MTIVSLLIGIVCLCMGVVNAFAALEVQSLTPVWFWFNCCVCVIAAAMNLGNWVRDKKKEIK